MFDHSGQQIVAAKVRERLAMKKQRSHSFHMERFNLNKLNEVEGKEQFRLRSQRDLQPLKIWMLRWKLVALGIRLDRI
jgi:hypothetical protein